MAFGKGRVAFRKAVVPFGGADVEPMLPDVALGLPRIGSGVRYAAVVGHA